MQPTWKRYHKCSKMAWAIPVALAGQWYVETAGQREQGLAGNGKTWQNQSLVEGSVGICCWRASSGLYTPMPCHKFFRKIPLYEFPAYICFDKVVLFMKGNPDMPQCGFSRAVAQAGLLELMMGQSFVERPSLGIGRGRLLRLCVCWCAWCLVSTTDCFPCTPRLFPW